MPHRTNGSEFVKTPWFALQVKARYENIIATGLVGKGYECFLPTYKKRRRWTDRIRESDQPLFPGYLFCRLDPLHRFPILVTPGVISIVGVGKVPVPVDEKEIDAIQTALSSHAESQPWPYLQEGQKVKVEYGPLTGLEGIVLDIRGQKKLLLSLTLLQRSVAIQLDRTWVAPAAGIADLWPAAIPGDSRWNSTIRP